MERRGEDKRARVCACASLSIIVHMPIVSCQLSRTCGHGRSVRACGGGACVQAKEMDTKNTPPSFFCPVEKERLCVGGSVAANACVRLAGHQGGVLGLRHSVTGNACVSARWLAGASTRGRPFFLSFF